MTRDLSDLPGEGEQRDLVADFFDRERAGIRDLPGGPDRWESILVESRRPRRRHVFPYLSAAAAVVVAAGVVWATGHGPGTQQAATPASVTGPVATVTVTATQGPVVVPAPTLSGSPSPTTQAGPLPAPKTFSLVSMSNGGGQRLYALGSATCPKGECTAVIGSDDDGSTWTTRAAFETLTTPGARSTPDRARQLVGVRFASTTVGYVYGSSTLRTVDGGRSWSALDVAGRTVLSLETDGRTVWMVTATSCSHGEATARGCTGLEVWSAAVTATRAAKVAALDGTGPADSAWLSMDGSDAYVSVSYADQAKQSLPQRVSGTPTRLARPQGCAATGGVWVWGTARTRGALVAMCLASGDPGKTYALATSTDRGATWSPAKATPDLATPGSSGVWLTAVDLRHLVVVLHGLPASAPALGDPTEILSTGDGGATWVRPTVVQGANAFSWVGAAGGPTVYAVAGGGGYDVSSDSGASFQRRSFRR
jgi:hypothetical protein